MSKQRSLLTLSKRYARSILVSCLVQPATAYAGPSVRVACQCGGDHSDEIVHYGDIDIIPAEMPARWEIYGMDRALLLGISQKLFDYVAESL